MAPKSGYPAQVLALISSTSYPDVPSLPELISLLEILQSQSSTVALRGTNDVSEQERLLKQARKEEKKRRRDAEESRERAALEANERSREKLEAVEKNRLAAGTASAGQSAPSSVRGPQSPSGVKVKRERSLSPAPSNASSASFRPQQVAGQPITYGSQNKLKKKKQRVLDSDDEASIGLMPRSPPHLTHTTSTSGLKLKLSHAHPKSRPSPHPDQSPTPSSAAGASSTAGLGIDFSLPSQPVRPLTPHRPGVQKPLKPGPKKQSEVNEDFSNVKAPSQVNFTTFWSSVEPYLRDIREDDLAMLGFKADAPELYDVPPRGRHYTEMWDEEDGNAPGTTSRYPTPGLRHAAHGIQSTSHFIPSNDLDDLVSFDEHRGLGPLTERLTAAVMSTIHEEDMREVEGRWHGDDSDRLREAARIDVVDLEERMRKELKAIMLLGEHEDYDPSNRDDDEVSAALRHCQRLLLQQTAVNDARRARIAEHAKSRIGYSEYQACLAGLEKEIEAGWAKRVKKYGIKKSANQPRPPVPEALKKAVRLRQQFIDTVGHVMKQRPRGEVVGLPVRSIYEGIGEEGEETDEGAVEDAMELESVDMDDGDVTIT